MNFLGSFLMRKRLVEGRTVRLELDGQQWERSRWSPWNPRLLVYVYVALQEGACEVDKVMVNAELVRQGYAQVVTRQPKTRQPNVKYQDRLLTLQREAWEARRGLWGAP